MLIACSSMVVVLYTLTYLGAMIDKVYVDGTERYVIHWDYIEVAREFPFVIFTQDVAFPPTNVALLAIAVVSVSGGLICAVKLTVANAR